MRIRFNTCFEGGDKSTKADSRFAKSEKVGSSKRGTIQRTKSRFSTSEKVTAPTRRIAREKARKVGGQ